MSRVININQLQLVGTAVDIYLQAVRSENKSQDRSALIKIYYKQLGQYWPSHIYDDVVTIHQVQAAAGVRVHTHARTPTCTRTRTRTRSRTRTHMFIVFK